MSGPSLLETISVYVAPLERKRRSWAIRLLMRLARLPLSARTSSRAVSVSRNWSSATDSVPLAAVATLGRNHYCGNPCCGNGYCCIVLAVSDLASSLIRTRTAVLVADDERRCVEATDRACQLLGVRRDQLLAKPIDDWLAADDRAHANSAWSEFLKRGTLTSRIRLRVPAGESAVIEFTATADVVPGRHLVMLRPLVDVSASAAASDDHWTAMPARGTPPESVENSAAPGHAKGVRLASVKGFAASAEELGSGTPRVSVQGEIDKATVDVVRRHAQRQIERNGPRLVLDLVRTSFMDSSGLHLIEALRRRTSEQGGALVLVVATYGVRRLLGIAPPSSDVLVVLARPQRDAAVGNHPINGRKVAA
jgi:anti-anti-sigma factor